MGGSFLQPFLFWTCPGWKKVFSKNIWNCPGWKEGFFLEKQWMEGRLFNKNITFGTVLDGRKWVREILFGITLLGGKVIFLVVKSHGKKEGCDFFLWGWSPMEGRKVVIFWGWSPMEKRKGVIFSLGVKSHGRKERCYFFGGEVPKKEDRLIFKY